MTYINEKIVETLLKQNCDAATFTNTYNKLADIHNSVKTYNIELANLKKEYETKTAHLKSMLRQRQNECSHLKTTFTPDPSGGSDSSYTCDICQKEIKGGRDYYNG